MVSTASNNWRLRSASSVFAARIFARKACCATPPCTFWTAVASWEAVPWSKAFVVMLEVFILILFYCIFILLFIAFLRSPLLREFSL
jgi:hypothetical protein